MERYSTTGAGGGPATGGKDARYEGRSISHHHRPRLSAGGEPPIITRLSGVRQTGPSRWIARCPAHDDRSPSLAVRETDDGRILIHCFGGCDVSAVVTAVGLTLSDLFPPRENAGTKPERAPFNALDVLRALRYEALVVSLAASEILNGRSLSGEDIGRLSTAYRRIDEAVRLSGGDYARR